jgi:NAD(P)-dependent dehydrogenase (short-subunit alcohol dehydrogenase family)
MQGEEYFHGKGCVVTGAASGIGFALTKALLQAGAVVFMADRDEKTLTTAVEQFSAYAGRVHSMLMDVTNQEQVQHMIEEAAARHGRLDILFNNAGMGGIFPIGKATLEWWRGYIDVNLWGVIYGIHFALPIMRKQGGGHIVTTASGAGLFPTPFEALYSTTKHAVVGLSESLRFELGDEGIYFSVVCPGPVATPLFGTWKPPEDAISADEAAQIALEGVANQQGIIALPEKTRQLWRQYWSSPEAFESVLWDLARQRRSLFQTKGS